MSRVRIPSLTPEKRAVGRRGWLPVAELSWLGGMAAHAAVFDRRWRVVTKAVRQRLGPGIQRLQSSDLDLLVAERKGRDEHFEAYGLLIPRVFPARQAKLLKREATLRQHPWLRLRALFGANWRADIVWHMIRQPELTPYQISRKLGCNTETAYRNYKLLREADAPALLKVA